ATDTAGLGDPDLFHDRPSLHLTDSGERLQQRDDLELAHDVVRLALLDHLPQRPLGVLQTVLDLRPDASCLGRLLEGRRTLFRGEWRKGHASHLLNRTDRTYCSLESSHDLRRRQSLGPPAARRTPDSTPHSDSNAANRACRVTLPTSPPVRAAGAVP